MQNPVFVRVLDSTCDPGHEAHAFASIVAQSAPGVLQTATGCVLHAEKRQTIFALTDLEDWKNVRVVETRSSFSFPAKPFQRFARIGVIRNHSFDPDDPPGMPL